LELAAENFGLRAASLEPAAERAVEMLEAGASIKVIFMDEHYEK
jgi:hypothetical protein